LSAVEKELLVDRVGQTTRGSRELLEPRPGIAPERVGLRRPIEIAERPGEAVELMFGGVVIVESEQAATPQVDKRAIRRSISAIA
jgi:hypothetical protein